MAQNMRTAVLMGAYNNAAVMRLTLDGYLRQSDRDFALVIADDGSDGQVADLLEEYRVKGLRITHWWQEDRGFRKALILNKAIAGTDVDYFIMVDNDCVPQDTFVADHKYRARRGHYVSGRRVDLGPALTQAFLGGAFGHEQLNNRWWLFGNGIAGKLRYAENGAMLPWFLSNLWSMRRKPVLGANMAMWKQDLLRVNGFDSDFVNPGDEECDLEWRLSATGVKPRSLLGRGCVVHMHHETRPRSDDNRQRLIEKRSKNVVWAENGISQTSISDSHRETP